MAIDGKELGKNSCKNIPMDIKHIMDFPVILHKVWSSINHFADWKYQSTVHHKCLDPFNSNL